MARFESDREDLLREATALRQRVELADSQEPHTEHVFFGFRVAGQLSVYVGGDLAYHFNSTAELRRAIADGRLYKAERGQVIELTRHRTSTAVELLRREMSPAEQHQFLANIAARLESLAAAVRAGRLVVVGQVPPDVDIVGRALTALEAVVPLRVAASAHAR